MIAVLVKAPEAETLRNIRRATELKLRESARRLFNPIRGLQEAVVRELEEKIEAAQAENQ